MAVTAANKASVLQYIQQNQIKFSADKKIDAHNNQVKTIAKALGLTNGAVAAALVGFDPKAPPDYGSISGASASSAPVSTGRQNFEALDPEGSGLVDHDNVYDKLLAAYKDLDKTDRKAELKWVESKQQYGLAQYLKQGAGGGGFWSALGNALGEWFTSR